MPLTVADIQRLITLRVGDIDPNTGDPPQPGGAGMVASNMATIWAAHADKAVVPRLQELYVQRDALDLIIGILRHQVDVVQGDPQLSVRMNQRVSIAQVQREQTQRDIDLVEKRASMARGGAIGEIKTRQPVTVADAYRRPWPVWADPSDMRYTGSPFIPSRIENP